MPASSIAKPADTHITSTPLMSSHIVSRAYFIFCGEFHLVSAAKLEV